MRRRRLSGAAAVVESARGAHLLSRTTRLAEKDVDIGKTLFLCMACEEVCFYAGQARKVVYMLVVVVTAAAIARFGISLPGVKCAMLCSVEYGRPASVLRSIAVVFAADPVDSRIDGRSI